MKKSMNSLIFILSWLFIILLVVYYIQGKEFYGANPIMRRRLEVKEAFQSPPVIQSNPDMTINGVSPGDPDLANLRQPYALLKDWLPLASEPIYKTAQTCHEADFQGRLEKTGNFRQLTNNYKRGDPDSCSGPIQDLTLAIYKTTPMPQTGCTQPYVE